MNRNAFTSRVVLRISLILAAFAFSVSTGRGDSPPAKLTVKPTTDETGKQTGWTIFDGDRVFAGYVADSGGKPIVYPIHGPGGHPMTRNFPMKLNYGSEQGDHDHQRSMWFTHGAVNGIDFWKDDEGCGKIVQRSSDAKATPDGSVVLLAHNDWNAPDGERVLSDTRRIEFKNIDARHRIVDFDVLLRASDGDVNFGDTKEGTFGIRVASSMRVDAKKGGLIINADGEINKDAWGKSSPWVDYSGPIDNELVGLTIHNHPSSFGFPTRWHVRTYGLFAANPFGRHHFGGEKRKNGLVLVEGKTMRLNYRIVLYQGKLDKEKTDEAMKSYQNDPRPVIE